MKAYIIVVLVILLMAYVEITEGYVKIRNFVLRQIKDILPILKICLGSILVASIVILTTRAFI